MNIYILSTMSDSGKTAIVSALLRILRVRGFHASPFKAQNMSLNSYPAIEGGEIALAQAMQAYVAGLMPSIYHNPILIKPMSSDRAEYVILGKPRAQLSFNEYLNNYPIRRLAINAVKVSIRRLTEEYDVVIGEGAGSAYEPNLANRDIANFRPAEWLGANVFVVLDIDRGGSFIQGLGLMRSLPPRWRRLVRGFIINKFRGDERLLDSAIKWLEERTGRPVLGGVLPYVDDLWLWPEDSMDLRPIGNGPLDIALIAYPYISNFNDVYPLILEDDVTVRVVRSPKELGEPHLVILPGSKNVVASLDWMRRVGLDRALMRIKGSAVILGICGGFQALGKVLSDPHGLEAGVPGNYNGLGLVNVNTVYGVEKIVSLSKAVGLRGGELEGIEVRGGYEIHRGVPQYVGDEPLIMIKERNGRPAEQVDGGVFRERDLVIGVTLHDSLGDPNFRNFVLNMAREIAGLPKRNSQGLTSIDLLMRQIDKFSSVVKDALNIDFMINNG
ncbi:cobyric acid synthase [Vulcanisaeta distributa]|uniref:cobyric acid synthase n=1 Tax=Vulcanisaeta distributa TaxID=164451 RepID=UPI0006CFD574|nr:cobyric acid synthase [Vulcanisaeta distributa]